MGSVGGFIGSILFGLIMQYMISAPLPEMAIPAIYRNTRDRTVEAVR